MMSTWGSAGAVMLLVSWGKLLDLLSFSVFSIFSLWIGIVFLQETVDSIPCPTFRWQVHVVLLT